MSYEIDDRRSAEDKEKTQGFVVANDSFMSGWGRASGRSIFAVPFGVEHNADFIIQNMEARSEMKYVRVSMGKNYRPKLRAGDHLSIRSMEDSSRFYEKHGFCER